MAPSYTQRFMRRSTYRHLRWVAVLVLLTVMRMIGQSIHLSSQFPGSDDDGIVYPGGHSSSRSRSRSRTRTHGAGSGTAARHRLPSKRTIQTPPLTNTQQSSLEWAAVKLPTTSLVLEVSSKSSIKEMQQKYANLCRAFNEDSRILVSGVTAHPVAIEAAYVLAHYCQVPRIMAISHQTWHADMLPPLSYVLQGLPGFQIFTDTIWTQEAMDHIIADFNPTHVLHFESMSMSLSLSSNHHHNNTTLPVNFAMRQSWIALQRCGRTLGRAASAARVLYITGKASRFRSTSSSLSSSRQLLQSTTRQIFPLGWQTFRQHYQVDVVNLELPPVYGPFEGSALSAHTILLPTDRDDDIASVLPRIYVTQHQIHPSTKMIHLDDAVDSILASLALPASDTSTLPRLKVPSNLLVTTQQIQSAMLEDDATIVDPTKKSLNDRSKLMLSWYHQSWWPFEDIATIFSRTQANNSSKTIVRKAYAMTNRRLDNNTPYGISWLQRQVADLMPCSSECAINTKCVKATLWTDDLFMISQNVTQDCRFVVYTSDFSSNLQELPLLKESTTKEYQWPKHTLCQVAFVSAKSKLMKRLFKEQGKPSNGQVTVRQWTVIWIKESESELSEADLFMPKIAPQPFFHHNVTRAMYIRDPPMTGGNSTGQKSHFPPRPFIWYLMAKQLDAKRQEARIKHDKRSGTSIPIEYWLPELPPRHVSIFSHAIGFSTDYLKATSVSSMAKFLVKKQGRVPWKNGPTRQLAFYQLAHETVYPITTLPDSYLLIHDLDSQHAKNLRCEWYQEHLVWNGKGASSKSHYFLEDLALAFVLAKRRAHGRLVGHDQTWGERLIDTADLISSSLTPVTGTSNVTVPLPSEHFVKLYMSDDE